MTDPLHSRSDLQALRRSGRGKTVVLGLVFAAAAGAAGYSFLAPSGVGNPEELHKLMVVSPVSGRSIALADQGFDVAEGSFEAWVRKAEDEVPDLEVTGVAAIMALADRFGYAHVVFEDPAQVDFSALEIEGGVPTLTATTRFAAVSAGEFSFPHKLTVSPEPGGVRGANTLLLQALFAQAPLQAALNANESPSIDVIKLRDRLGEAIDTVEMVPLIERKLEGVKAGLRQVWDGEKAEPAPALVGDAWEIGRPVPLANGEILTRAQAFEIYSEGSLRLTLDPEDGERFVAGPVGTPAADRVACSSLHAGALDRSDSAKLWYADDGSAVLIKSLSEGMVLWTLAPQGPGCEFSRRGSVRAAAPGLGRGAPAVSGRSGKIARAGDVRGEGVVEVVTAGASDSTLLGMVPDVMLTGPTWLGERYLFVEATGVAGSGVLVLDVERPLAALLVPISIFGGATGVADIATGGTVEDPTVVVVTDDSRLYAWRPGAMQTLFEAPPVAEGSPPAPDEARAGKPVVSVLDTNALRAKLVVQGGEPRNPVVSPDATRVAFRIDKAQQDGTHAERTEIAVASLVAAEGSAGIDLVTSNDFNDLTPRFTADGKHLVFGTRVAIPDTSWKVTVGRVAPVP